MYIITHNDDFRKQRMAESPYFSVVFDFVYRHLVMSARESRVEGKPAVVAGDLFDIYSSMIIKNPSVYRISLPYGC
jgi:hypothetical protein